MRVGALGPFRIAVDGELLELAGRRRRRLAAALVLGSGRPVSIDRLVEVVWQGRPPSRPRRALRTQVYRLRRELGDAADRLETAEPGYRLRLRDEELDTERFVSLVAESRETGLSPSRRLSCLDRAEALWRGPAWVDVADEPFARSEAQRLDELRRSAAEDRFAVRLRLAAPAEVVADLHAFVDRHPLRERPHDLLMRALVRSGRTADALEVARDFRRRLDRDLGLPLPPAIDDLQTKILRHELDADDAAVDEVEPSIDARHPDRSRVPTFANRLVGRDDELDAVHDTLRTNRLVTLVGPGGVGKTRLAVAVARAGPWDPAQVWWCDLATVDTAPDVEAAVAGVVGARLTGTQDDPVASLLGDASGLVVLDNAEHVRDGVSALAAHLLDRCAAITLLVTSRVPLGLAGERVRPVEPLRVTTSASTAAPLAPALELLQDRAAAVRPGLALVDERPQLATELCRRLDGIPLAIELAASRLRSLGPDDLVDRLDDRLDLLVDDRRDDPRHRRLRATIEWSFADLSSVEQAVLARLSVFAGSFTLSAAEAVAAGGEVGRDEVLDLLSRLVDHSLVALVSTAPRSCYHLLESVRARATEHLHVRDEHDEIAGSHAAHHLALAEDADRAVRGRDEAAAVARIDREFDDLRAAHHHAIRTGDVDVAMRLVVALFRYALWRLRPEVFGWATEAIDLPGAVDHPLLPVVAGVGGWGAGLRGELDEADRLAAFGLDATEDVDDPRGLVALEVRMHVALWRGDLEACLAAADRAASLPIDPYDLVPAYVPALALTYAGRPDDASLRLDHVMSRARAHGNPTMRALVQYALGEALHGSDPAAARRALRTAIELAETVDNHMVLGVADVSLGSLAARDGDPRDGLATFDGVVRRLRRAGDWTHLWIGLRTLVGLLRDVARPEAAAVLLGAVRNAPGAPPAYGDDAAALADHDEALDDELPPDVFDDAIARGSAMTGAAAADFALATIHDELGPRTA
ncbi:BTAD domain-containing putative transcriptional regulator [Salsipaludibacter albus]|uniref:BTAD domain-containing putative transcriptional regulator n=1 Tax=Salsipaludibacter albus TaxID=2849650 RepID=UPI001EE47296|nr:BTAD domain-containing putative transcriptional regulator [Salsipaludibacter albus]MBY5161309.1 winged helix-turn-helix domain-containing protein [Salsipaludibacter albus]